MIAAFERLPRRQLISFEERAPFHYIRLGSQSITPRANDKPETAAEAIYPGKEAWKNEPGNRYTAEELREMHRNWRIKITPAKSVHTRRAD